LRECNGDARRIDIFLLLGVVLVSAVTTRFLDFRDKGVVNHIDPIVCNCIERNRHVQEVNERTPDVGFLIVAAVGTILKLPIDSRSQTRPRTPAKSP
jgi:hypothetical protein